MCGCSGVMCNLLLWQWKSGRKLLGSGKSAGPGAPFQTSRWCSRAAAGWELSFGKQLLSSGWGECSVLWLRSVYSLEG